MFTRPIKLSRSLIPLLALTLAAFLPAVSASAATPEELVDHCINRMMQTTQQTVDAIRTAGVEGIQKIESLDANDAPVPVMIRVAQMTIIRIETRANWGAGIVNMTANRCLHILADIEADPALGEIIHGARIQALRAIHTAAHRTRAAVRHALEAALEDEGTPEEIGGDGSLDPASPV